MSNENEKIVKQLNQIQEFFVNLYNEDSNQTIVDNNFFPFLFNNIMRYLSSQLHVYSIINEEDSEAVLLNAINHLKYEMEGLKLKIVDEKSIN